MIIDANVLPGPWPQAMDEETRQGQLTEVRARRRQGELLYLLTTVAVQLERDGFPRAARHLLGHYGWGRDLRTLLPNRQAEMQRLAEDLELDLPGATMRAAGLLREAARVLVRS